MADGFRVQPDRYEGAELTGLEPAEVPRWPDTQKLKRLDESGVRDELRRVPVKTMIDDSEG